MEMECPVLLGRSSQPMDFQQFRATINRLQYYDSFPGDGDTENQLHKIVKKQMAISDYKDMKKNKRSISEFPEIFDDHNGEQYESYSQPLRAAADPAPQPAPVNRTETPPPSSSSSTPAPSSSTTPPKKTRSIWRKASSGTADARAKGDASQPQSKNKNNPWFRHELRHRRWPRRRSFSRKHSRSMGVEKWGKDTPKRGISKQSFDNTDEPDPPNEWLDASKGGVIQKIPAEFRPKKKPRLKIYHLRVKRKLHQMTQNNIVSGHRGVASDHIKNHRKTSGSIRGMHGTRHHQPRSFVIRINKKYGKDNQDEKITDGDENDEEDEETEEEEDDDEDPDEDEDAEEEDELEAKQSDGGVTNHKESFRDLLRSAKAAVTNRVKFTEAGLTEASQKPMSHVKGKKSEMEYSPKSKKVLIDANIKVDSALSDVLKNILKTTGIASVDKSGMASDSDLSKSSELLLKNPPSSRKRREKGH